MEMMRPLYYFTAPGMLRVVSGHLWVKYSGDVLPRGEFDVRADAVGDNACGG